MGKKRKHVAVAPAPGVEAGVGGAAAAAVATQTPSQPAAVSAGKSGPSKKQQRVLSHVHTDVAPTGLGQQLSTAPGRLALEPLPLLSSSQPAAKWAPPLAAPSCCPSNPAAAAELELARAAALDTLRHKLASLAAKAGLRNVPMLAFERWRFAAKWAEDEPQLAAAGAGAEGNPDEQQQQQQEPEQKKAKHIKHQTGDPVIPFASLTVAPEPGLITDLIRAGLEAAAAVEVATQLAAAAAAAAAALVKKRQQLQSGKAACLGGVQVAFHKHSLDFTCGGMFVKVSRPAYGKLARLYRQHWLDRGLGMKSPAAAAAAGGGGDSGGGAGSATSACSIGLPVDQAAVYLNKLQGSRAGGPAAAAAAADGGISDEDSGSEQGGGSEGIAAGDVKASSSGRDNGSHPSSSSSGKGASDKQLLDAEACIAELEAAAAAAAEGPGTAGSTGGSTGGGSSTRADFHARLFALLLRYKSIQGHGFQAAAGPSVFSLLRQQLSVGYECFASPLNAHFARYGSAFPDVDAPFGSGGSFFRMQLKHGSFQVNPPFVPSILTAAAQHMLRLLAAAEAAGSALCFVVLMPGWQEVTGWQLLNSSSFRKQSLLLAAADHGYCDGASHQRKDLYRQSPYDSSIIFLQTTAAARKWPVAQQLLNDLQVAFAACCPSAAAAERQQKQRGVKDLEAKGYGVPVRKLPAAAAAGVVGSDVAAGDNLGGKGTKKGAAPDGEAAAAGGVQGRTKHNKKGKLEAAAGKAR